MAKEYKSLANKWYTGQYDDDDQELEEQIKRMREEDAAYARETARNMPRPATSAGIFITHDTAPQMAKEVTAQQQQQNYGDAGALNGLSQPASYGHLRNRPSRDTDSTSSSFQTGPQTAGSSKPEKSTRTFSPPGTAQSRQSSRSGSSGKSKKPQKKKKKKGSFWSALREESKSLSNNWYTSEADHMASRAGSA
jgi:hypothetical protein